MLAQILGKKPSFLSILPSSEPVSKHIEIKSAALGNHPIVGKHPKFRAMTGWMMETGIRPITVAVVSTPSEITVGANSEIARTTVPYPSELHPTPAPISETSVEAALLLNDWFPDKHRVRKSNHYMDPNELNYYTMKVVQVGSLQKAGKDGDKFVELIDLLARNYLGRIAFKDNGHMSNLADDLVQEATAKCCLVVHKFQPWNLKDPLKKKLNNSFAYFTTIIRNKMLETLDSALGSDKTIYLEDLRTENQSIADVI